MLDRVIPIRKFMQSAISRENDQEVPGGGCVSSMK